MAPNINLMEHSQYLHTELPSWPQRLTVAPEQAGRRLDVFLAEQLPTFSRVDPAPLDRCRPRPRR